MATSRIAKKPLEAAVMYKSKIDLSASSEALRTLWAIENFPNLRDHTVYKSAEDRYGRILLLAKKRTFVRVEVRARISLLENFICCCTILYVDKTESVAQIEPLKPEAPIEIGKGMYQLLLYFDLGHHAKQLHGKVVYVMLLTKEDTRRDVSAGTAGNYLSGLKDISSKFNLTGNLLNGFEDFEVRGKDFALPVSRCALAARSLYFLEYFQTHPGADSLELDIPKEVFAVVLHYIHFGVLDLGCSLKTVLAVFEWAVHLGVTSLRMSLLLYLMEFTNEHNALEMRNVGIKTREEKLVEMADHFLIT